MDQTAQNEASAVREAIESLDPGLYPCQLLARLWYAFLAGFKADGRDDDA